MVMEKEVNGRKITIKVGDITEEDVDAIVNAANTRLFHGGGVAGAIVKKGGLGIQLESTKIGHCPVGGAVVTGAGRLKARYVIHTVGPRMGEGDEEAKLESAALESLKRAQELDCASMAFPAVSAGIYGYPIEKCAEIMLGTVKNYLEGDTSLSKVVFCLFSQEAYDVFEETICSLP
jgi:O-acetyl-ADP-ribose deacetylase (regulator of RNase III)